MKWFLDALGKYAVFQGRSRRKEYWYFFLFFALISILLTLFDMLIGTYNRRYQLGLFSTIFTAATFVPWVALSARRLHDIGYSGKWLWVMLVCAVVMAVNPVIGIILLFVLSVAFAVAAIVNGDPGANRYGPASK
jgi:uncharacterized membrane protein YhaH (DUF805 family)